VTAAPPELDPAQAADEPYEPSEPGRAGRLLTLLLGALCLLLALASVLLYLRVHKAQDLRDARSGALAAAKQEALNLATISQDKVDKNLQDVIDGASGDFRAEYSARVPDVKRVVTENQVTSTANVVEVGLVSGGRTKATAIVAVDALVKNKAVPGGTTRYYRMKLVLTRQDDTWLTTTLELVG
jgi:Mce-associated membrane protein